MNVIEGAAGFHRVLNARFSLEDKMERVYLKRLDNGQVFVIKKYADIWVAQAVYAYIEGRESYLHKAKDINVLEGILEGLVK